MKARHKGCQEFQPGVPLEFIRWQRENPSAQLFEPSSLNILIGERSGYAESA
jgi:hypothetical protein